MKTLAAAGGAIDQARGEPGIVIADTDAHRAIAVRCPIGNACTGTHDDALMPVGDIHLVHRGPPVFTLVDRILPGDEHLVAVAMRPPEHFAGVLAAQIPQQQCQFAADSIQGNGTRDIPVTGLYGLQGVDADHHVVRVDPAEPTNLRAIGHAHAHDLFLLVEQIEDRHDLGAADSQEPGPMRPVRGNLGMLHERQLPEGGHWQFLGWLRRGGRRRCAGILRTCACSKRQVHKNQGADADKPVFHRNSPISATRLQGNGRRGRRATSPPSASPAAARP